MLTEMLTSLGYQVTAFCDSKDALNAFCGALDDFDLVITDMTMPGLTGQELAREVLLVKPDFPIILCTGFSELMNEEEARRAGIREYIMKPVVMSELAQTIRRALRN
ncbi:MAG: C4-dicarboxylate transport transcriptional regulatory protein DctD [Deltaproteobacteria bacterium ADurb.Bin510]|nr:MAG: C4-dicarboxylate transport transcriptional regulatory protein DctD [Deltaproteobacteria bacterium ADurb.Bin510]